MAAPVLNSRRRVRAQELNNRIGHAENSCRTGPETFLCKRPKAQMANAVANVKVRLLRSTVSNSERNGRDADQNVRITSTFLNRGLLSRRRRWKRGLDGRHHVEGFFFGVVQMVSMVGFISHAAKTFDDEARGIIGRSLSSSLSTY